MNIFFMAHGGTSHSGWYTALAANSPSRRLVNLCGSSLSWFLCVCDVVFRLEQKKQKQHKHNTTHLVDPLCKVCSASHPWNRIEDTSGATHICSYTYLEQHISGATHGFVFGLPRPTPPHCYNCTLEYCCRLDVLSFFSDTHSLNKLSSTIVGKLRRLKGHCLSKKTHMDIIISPARICIRVSPPFSYRGGGLTYPRS